jgi:hypothetical protein
MFYHGVISFKAFLKRSKEAIQLQRSFWLAKELQAKAKLFSESLNNEISKAFKILLNMKA